MNVGNPTSGAKGGTTSKRESMKTVNHIKLNYQLFWLIIPAMLHGSLAGAASARLLAPGGNGDSTNTPLDSRAFGDHANRTSGPGCLPVSFNNLGGAAGIATLNVSTALRTG